jgi:predicted O-linked N-acetylglucosamine transferase (SPINDLY family)
LRNIELDDLIAGTREAYHRITTDLAVDLSRLDSLHTGLRGRKSRSRLMDAQRLTRDLEFAYSAIWAERSASRG